MDNKDTGVLEVVMLVSRVEPKVMISLQILSTQKVAVVQPLMDIDREAVDLEDMVLRNRDLVLVMVEPVVSTKMVLQDLEWMVLVVGEDLVTMAAAVAAADMIIIIILEDASVVAVAEVLLMVADLLITNPLGLKLL